MGGRAPHSQVIPGGRSPPGPPGGDPGCEASCTKKKKASHSLASQARAHDTRGASPPVTPQSGGLRPPNNPQGGASPPLLASQATPRLGVGLVRGLKPPTQPPNKKNNRGFRRGRSPLGIPLERSERTLKEKRKLPGQRGLSEPGFQLFCSNGG